VVLIWVSWRMIFLPFMKKVISEESATISE